MNQIFITKLHISNKDFTTKIAYEIQDIRISNT